MISLAGFLALGCILSVRTEPTLPATGEDDARGLEFFEARIRPVLVENCYACHSPAKKAPRGGLRLDSKRGWMEGGDSGPAIVPGDPGASLLVRAVRYEDALLQMPPDGRLADQEIADLVAWVAMGAPDPRTEATSDAPERSVDLALAHAHWAFQPIADPSPPDVRDQSWPRNAIDRFVLARLEAESLHPAPPAERRAWIRRVHQVLIGLPPTPEEVEAFVADDAPDAFERVVERLLASPHYGERWGRHWLDVARYSDSNGLDENLAFGNAWRYRDWVVRALNEDLSYDRFVAMQLAGDLLPAAEDEAHRYDGRIATGFLALGPKMLAEQDKEKLVMDVVDEQIDVASRAFLGLTAGCARCHDHKFDPIPTRDYYALAGVFKSTSTMEDLEHVSRWRERELASEAELAARAAWQETFAGAERAIEELVLRGKADLEPRWRRDFAAYLLAGTEASRAALFVEAEDYSRANLHADSTHWGTPTVTIVHTSEPGLQFAEYDLSFARACHQQLELRYAAEEARPVRILVNGALVADGALVEATGSWLPDGQVWSRAVVIAVLPGRNVLRIERDGAVPHVDKLLLLEVDGPEASSAWPEDVPYAAGLEPRAVRGFADYLVRGARAREPIFALWRAFADLSAEHFASAAEQLVPRLRDEIAAQRFVCSPLVARLIDGLPPSSLRELAGRYQTLFAVVDDAWRRAREVARDKPLPERLADAAQEELRAVLYGDAGPFALPNRSTESLFAGELRDALAAARAERDALKAKEPPPFPSALCVQEGEAVDVAVHVRGSHLALGDEPVPRGFLGLAEPCLEPPPIGPSESGRMALARWITDPRHPLTARVLVNRLWQGHFGEGLVQSPSNFGLRGEEPSHPELLDWLARELVRRGWSLKEMHRLILASSTARMSSRFDEACAARDPENRLLWRVSRRRLDAESVRDALLAASGELDLTLGGSLLATANRGYVTNDQSNDEAQYASPRRSIYLPVIRNATYDLFATFDYNDPSVPLEKRSSTTVPSQALLLMNSPLALQSAAGFAERVLGADQSDDAQRLALAYSIAYGRPPDARESEQALRFLGEMRTRASLPRALPIAATEADAHPATSEGPRPVHEANGAADSPERFAWQQLCHVLLSSNEFLHVD